MFKVGERYRFRHGGTWQDEVVILRFDKKDGEVYFMPDHHRIKCVRGCSITLYEGMPHGTGKVGITGSYNSSPLFVPILDGVTYE